MGSEEQSLCGLLGCHLGRRFEMRYEIDLPALGLLVLEVCLV